MDDEFLVEDYENVLKALDSLIDDISDKNMIETLTGVKESFEDEFKEQIELAKERIQKSNEEETRYMNRDYERNV